MTPDSVLCRRRLMHEVRCGAGTGGGEGGVPLLRRKPWNSAGSLNGLASMSMSPKATSSSSEIPPSNGSSRRCLLDCLRERGRGRGAPAPVQ